MSGITITQGFLFAISFYVAVASVTIFLTLVLRPSVTRWLNTVLPILYIVSIVASVFGEDPHFYFLSVIEIALLGAIVWFARFLQGSRVGEGAAAPAP